MGGKLLPVATGHDLGVGALGCGKLEKLSSLVNGGLRGTLGQEVGCKIGGVPGSNSLASNLAKAR